MQKNLYIPIDIQIKNIVECTQLIKRGDTLTLIIKVFNNAVLADLTSQSVDLILKKSDGKLIEKTITSVSNGVITATLDVQATNVAGIVQGEVQIYTSDTLSSTNTFTFNVDSSLADDVLEASQDDIEVLADLKNTITAGNAAIDKYKENVEAIASSADAVEALADIKLYIDTNLADLQQANAQATTNIGNETSQNTQAVQNISDLTAINNTSSTLKSELDSNIGNGNTLKSGLESDITNGNALKSNLETDFATGNQLKSDLDSTISTGDTLKTNLDTANTQAEANIEALNALGDVTEIAQDVTNLKNEVETARGTYNNLGARLDADESNITSNSNKIGDLSANGLTEANLATAIKNDRAQLSEDTQQLAQISNPSLLINDNFQIYQRSSNGTFTNPASGTYTYDRWRLDSSSGNHTLTKTANGISWVTTGEGRLRQLFEDVEMNKLLGKTVTLSAKFKGTLEIQFADFGSNTILVSSGSVSNTDFAVTSITINIPSTVGGRLGAYLHNTNSSVEIAYAKLELGSIATPFVPRPYGEEEMLCKRYYENNFIVGGHGVVDPNGNVAMYIPYKVTKRISPTVTVNSSLLSNCLSQVGYTPKTPTSITLSDRDINGNFIFFGGLTGAVGYNITIADNSALKNLITADAEIY